MKDIPRHPGCWGQVGNGGFLSPQPSPPSSRPQTLRSPQDSSLPLNLPLGSQLRKEAKDCRMRPPQRHLCGCCLTCP